MSSLSLTFSQSPNPELIRLSFSNQNGLNLISIRGKTSGAFVDCPTFQWSSAVHALAIFFVRSAQSVNETAAIFALEGEAGSAAASLDFALSKQPLWLIEMFGFDEDGNSLLRNIIRRSNSNRKRSGPVFLSLNESYLSRTDVSLFVGERRICSSIDVDVLTRSLAEQWETRRLRSTRNNLLGSSISSKGTDIWEGIVREELWQMLRGNNIFERKSLLGAVSRISSNPSFVKIAGKDARVISEIDLNGSSSARLGLGYEEKELRSAMSESGKIRVAVPISAVGTIALLNYLKHIKQYPIEICHQFPHTLALRRRILEGDFTELPDAFVLGSAPAAMFLSSNKKTDYTPFMLMPSGSQQIVTPRGSNSEISSGTYLYMNDEPSTSSFYFEDLVRRKIINPKRVSSVHLEPEDGLSWLNEREQDFRAILFYPYANLFRAIDACKFIENPTANSGNSDMILFVHQLLLRDKKKAQFLNIILRNAWLTLLEDPKVFDQVVKLTANSAEYKKCVRRYAGLSLIGEQHQVLNGLLG